jgi:MSHA pilin protein MshA
MKDERRILRNQKGFTLIEIIAVLVILGILAAVAVPKYIDMAGQAKINAAMGEVSEVKSSLNLAYSKAYLTAGTQPTVTQVITASGFTSAAATNIGAAPDVWNVTVTATGTGATIAVNSHSDGTTADTGYTNTGSWNMPTP